MLSQTAVDLIRFFINNLTGTNFMGVDEEIHRIIS
jgi:hypothetical protein